MLAVGNVCAIPASTVSVTVCARLTLRRRISRLFSALRPDAAPHARRFDLGAGAYLTIEQRGLPPEVGPCVRVFAKRGRLAFQALRFDCFEHDAHYHYDPYGRDEQLRIEHVDPRAWVLAKIAEDLPQMLGHAGYAKAAAQMDAAVLASQLTEIREAIELATIASPPSSS